MTERILRTTLAALLLSAVFAAPSEAGRYHVYSCRMPDGAVAPVDGWSGSATGTFSYDRDTCAEGGSLVAALGDQAVRTANTDVASWGFAAPAGDNLVAARVWRAEDADGGASVNAIYGAWLAAPLNRNDPADAFSECAAGSRCPDGLGSTSEPLASENLITVPTSKLSTHLYANVGCFGENEFECPTGQGDPDNYAAALYLYAADLTLEQPAGPTVSSVGGELATAPEISGTADLTFTATDPGTGVYQALVTADGRPLQTTVLDEDGGRCHDVGQTTDGLPAFLYLQPCPPSVSADLPVDLSSLSPGPHHLVVSVTDAAGNEAPALDRTITVPSPPAAPGPGGQNAPGEENGGGGQSAAGGAGAQPQAADQLTAPLPGAPNGAVASLPAVLTARWRSTASARLTTTFGRAETITGRLTDAAGQPIAGAQIAMLSTPAFAGAATSTSRGPVTKADGSFAIRLSPRLSSRTIRFTYAARAGEAATAASRTLQLAVRAPVAMTVAPRTASSRGTIRFSGRLLAGPLPKGGKPVILEARSGRGAWIEFRVVRSGARGRFSAAYRFRFPGPASYQFRAVCEQEADYPFATGSSAPVSVHER